MLDGARLESWRSLHTVYSTPYTVELGGGTQSTDMGVMHVFGDQAEKKVRG